MAAVLSLVLFDMDDVLCDYSKLARARHIAKLAGRTPEEVFAAIWESGFESEGDAGTLEAAAYLAGFGERIGYKLSLDEWIEARRIATQVRPEMLDLVRRLTVRSAILTNNPTLIADHIERIVPELPALFAGRLHASAGLKAAKPDAACFHRCLAQLGASPEQTLFIDDLAENVEGAWEAGLMGHQYVSVGALAALLRTHGVLRPP